MPSGLDLALLVTTYCSLYGQNKETLKPKAPNRATAHCNPEHPRTPTSKVGQLSLSAQVSSSWDQNSAALSAALVKLWLI